jgi:hypothetical protein
LAITLLTVIQDVDVIAIQNGLNAYSKLNDIITDLLFAVLDYPNGS